MLKDVLIICCDCGKNFTFGVGEQAFFASKELVNEPKRCPYCRIVTRAKRRGGEVDKLTEISCSLCGEMTMVPFSPTGFKPLFCINCLVSKGRGEDHD
ncbi:MAG: zinc-ribbon domain-containing protein [Candidatus Obscuribacterales bacterium]|nr:zinc-ribbon domain-containing protein [Candidatus Obscuribacterales bacterium]